MRAKVAKEKGEKETTVIADKDIEEGDIIWQDDPDFDAKMAKAYPNKVTKKIKGKEELKIIK